MKRWTRCCAVLAPLAMFAGVAYGDTLESVEKAIIEQGKTIRSMSWKSTSVSDIVSDTMTIHSESETLYEFMTKGEKQLFRNETSYTNVTDISGTKTTSKGTSLSVGDGEFNYVHSVNDGMESVMKMRATPQAGGAIQQSYFDTMAKTYNLELMPDAKVGSHSVYVIRAVLKNPSPMAAAEQFLYFDKATGMMIKMVGKDSAGKVMMETLTTDLKINSSISADRFVFTAPEGVQVMDMTQPQDYSGQPSQNAQANESPQSSGKSNAGADASGESPKDESAKPEEEKTEKKKKKKSKWPKLPKKKWP
ncbi:MAG: outer membrane lipoprotein carrier protein LolA [Planctomycetes bacterium]|nr:outer membrane lipoprotein carrier protein LolA [Planctomycetota bacterium]